MYAAATARFAVGDGATVNGYSDRRAATVVATNGTATKAPTWVEVVLDKATLLNGPESGEPDALKVYPGGFAAHWEGQQRYSYQPGDGPAVRYTLRANGRWIRQHSPMKGGERLTWGRNHFYDYNF